MTPRTLSSAEPVKVSSIIGTEVVNPKGENLGDIKEVLIDPHFGRVAFIVVFFGGFLTMGEKLFAIPYSAFDYLATSNEYVLNLSQERLKDAPVFDSDHWPTMSDERLNRDLLGFYGRAPYW